MKVYCLGELMLVLLSLAPPVFSADKLAVEDAGSLTDLDLQTLMTMEITVTAQKRSQSMQDVAISMDAYTARQVRELGLENVQDIARYTPNMHFLSFFEAGKPEISIRGISIGQLFTNFEQAPVGIYYDEVFIGSRSGQLAQMFDQERVEVLRGPQGTLYGRNTTAGAINFIAKKPTDQFEADASVSYGRFNEVDIDGGVTMPLADTLSVRISGIKRQRDGWQTNVDPEASPSQRHLDDIDNWGARALLQWKPNDQTTWLLSVHGAGNDTNSPVLHADLGAAGVNAANTLTGYLGSGRWDQVSANDPSKELLKAHGVALTGTIGLGTLTLTSISAYEKTDYAEAEDNDGSPYELLGGNDRDVMSQYSQELRIASSSSRIDWVAGLFYYQDHLSQRSLVDVFVDPFFNTPAFAAENITGMISENFPIQISRNYAAFGDVRFALTGRWTLDVGARYTYEAKHFRETAYETLPFLNSGTFQTIGGSADTLSTRDPSWSAPTGRVALEYKPMQDLLAYGSVSHGFKSGGINGEAYHSSSELQPYDPEKIDTYELGLKSAWLEGQFTANAAVFYNRLKDIQSLVLDMSGLLFVRNAASGTSKGAELELRAHPTNHWDISLGLGLLDTRFGRFVLPDGTDYSGREFADAPKVTGNALVQYQFAIARGTLAPHVDVAYTSHQWFDSQNRPGIDDEGGYALLDAAIPWRSRDEHVEISLWGRNLTDKHYFLDTIGNNVFLGAAVSYHADPRTYGVTARYSFK